MTSLENLRKQAKQLRRWHRDGYYPVAARIRAGLPAFRRSTDVEILAAEFPLARALDLVALEQGYSSWVALRTEWSDMPTQPATTTARLTGAYPQVFTRDLPRSLDFYTEQLGFEVGYVYGEPAFYALVRRDFAALNLRLVHHDPFDREQARTESLLAAYVPVENVKALYLELRDRGVAMTQPLTAQPWGTRDFLVADPDGNLICFSELAS